ncbi:DinB family protein [Herbihabitans rhizosphaerae]|uniref:DinB family protein n=1 Tax=Herbihabitans rhizosphaerae TaxID=1872711 RepID=A0A4V2ESI9_9PSEU|nr:DinB family protein [Herbihabitans rhizosphaerae]RZS37733.1 DinB family protein [Herbihabitans rhizosphaerae]
MDDLPALAGEEHFCPLCRVNYQRTTIARAVETITAIPGAARAAVAEIPEAARAVRPSAGEWSVVEYVCHLRDVYASYTIRLYRARTEDRPAVEPMLNNLRATRFRYIDWNVEAALDELDATAAGFREEIARVREDEWERTVTRLPHEVRTARWLVRQAMHEGTHHLHDIERTGSVIRAASG